MPAPTMLAAPLSARLLCACLSVYPLSPYAVPTTTTLTMRCMCVCSCLRVCSVSIHFYDENDEIEVPKGDQDVEMLAQGLLRLPSSVPVPQRAPVHSEDVLSVIRFIDAFKAELKLPKCTLNELQVGAALVFCCQTLSSCLVVDGCACTKGGWHI